jgi:flagellar motor switch protein FliM
MLTTPAAQGGAPAKRLDASLARANVVERLPMLAVTLQRAGEICAEALQEVSANVPLLTLKGIENGCAETLVGSGDSSIVAGMVYATKWDARLLVTLRQDAVLALLEIMFGGDGSEPADLGTRPLSKIEVGLARRFFARLATALEQAFADLAETPFVVEPSEHELDLESFAGGKMAMAIAKYQIDWCGRGGEIALGVPQSTLAEMRTLLATVPKKEKQRPADPHWVQRIEQEITRSKVVLSAILDERPMLLGELMSLKVGQVLDLAVTAHSRVRMECNNEKMLWCHLGKCNGVYTLRVARQVDQEQEFLDDISVSMMRRTEGEPA